MKFTRRHLADLPFCYAVSAIEQERRTKLVFASEERGPCYGFDVETFAKETVWEGPGGTMSIVPLPGMNGEFLAVQGFYPNYNAAGTEIVHASFNGREWQVETLFRLPFIHRFDILERNGTRYIFCCTLCEAKKDYDDWSMPGALYAAELPDDLPVPIPPTKIADGMTRNHGYWRLNNGKFTSALTACDQGVFEVIPPAFNGGEWSIGNILPMPVSDIALCDIDGDGVSELAAIEPFHGDVFTIYRKAPGGWSLMYRYPEKLPFCHVVWGGYLRGKPVFIGGCRSGDRRLFILHWRDGAIRHHVIDTGLGPSNVAVITGRNADILAVANRESGNADIYLVED